MHNLTDVDNFDIAVPSCDPTDPALPASFEPSHQSLANRTAWLKNRQWYRLDTTAISETSAALTGTPGAWTTIQTITTAYSCNVGDLLFVEAGFSGAILAGASGFWDLFFTDATAATTELERRRLSSANYVPCVSSALYVVLHAGVVQVDLRISPISGSSIAAEAGAHKYVRVMRFIAPGH